MFSFNFKIKRARAQRSLSYTMRFKIGKLYTFFKQIGIWNIFQTNGVKRTYPVLRSKDQRRVDNKKEIQLKAPLIFMPYILYAYILYIETNAQVYRCILKAEMDHRLNL